MSMTVVKTVTLRNDNTLVDENNQEIPVETNIHCLGALFKVTSSGLNHVVGKIDDDTHFANPKYFCRLNEPAFSEQPDVTTTPDAAPQKEGLLASAYRIMTAPFLMRTPRNVTTRNKKRKSSPNKMVHINEIKNNLTSKAESTNATSLGASSPKDSMKVPPPNEMYLFNGQCEKSMAEEVQFYFKSYKEFVNCENDRLKVIISASNVANVGCYNDLRIKYPGFMLEPQPVYISKLLQVIQSICQAQVVQYSPGASKKDEAKASDAVTTGNKYGNSIGLFLRKGKDQVGLFPSNSSPKNYNKSNEHLRDFDMDQSVEEINEQGS